MLPSLGRWWRATLFGWLLGVPVIAVLAAVGEAARLDGAQSLVGAGMGLAVGAMQAHALRDALGARWHWTLATMGALALPFIGFDIAKYRDWNVGYSLQWAVALGSVVAGIAQSRMLARRFDGASWWIPASVIGWSLAVAILNALDRFGRSLQASGVVKLAVFAGGVVLGGTMLGLTTGVALRSLRHHPD